MKISYEIQLSHNAEVARIIGKKWRELTKQQREEFQRLAVEDKLRYQRVREILVLSAELTNCDKEMKEYEKMRLHQQGIRTDIQQEQQQSGHHMMSIEERVKSIANQLIIKTLCVLAEGFFQLFSVWTFQC